MQMSLIHNDIVNNERVALRAKGEQLFLPSLNSNLLIRFARKRPTEV